jgi:hypothetical protein
MRDYSLFGPIGVMSGPQVGLCFKKEKLGVFLYPAGEPKKLPDADSEKSCGEISV